MKEPKRSDKFVYQENDIHFVEEPKKKKKKKVKEEELLSFTQFLEEKENSKFVTFDPATMRWITIHDRERRLQHILIRKKDSVILGGMGGEETGKKLGDVFDEIKNEQEEQKNIEEFRKNAIQGEKIHEVNILDDDSLSDEEYNSIHEYTGSAFILINMNLRNNVQSPESTQRVIDNVHNALRNYKTKEDMITYRGMNSSVLEKLTENFKVGKVFQDNGFCSTSSERRVAKSFSSTNGYIMEVHIPKGTHAASVNSMSKYKDSEYEVLIDMKSKFLIQNVDHEGKTVVVEVIQD